MKIKEPEVTREIRAVRDRMAGEVEREGIFAFYSSLNGRAAKLMARHRSPHSRALPRSAAVRKAKRQALLEALPEPSAIREVRRIREEMFAEEERIGSEKFWSEVKRKGSKFARQHGLRYAESPSRAEVLHDKPLRKHKVLP